MKKMRISLGSDGIIWKLNLFTFLLLIFVANSSFAGYLQDQETYQNHYIRGLWKHPAAPDRYILITDELGSYDCRQSLGDRAQLTVICASLSNLRSTHSLSYDPLRERFCDSYTVACAGGAKVNESNASQLMIFGLWINTSGADKQNVYKRVEALTDILFVEIPID
jgi:hypothetical protein